MTIGIDGVLGKPMIREGQGIEILVRRSLRDVFRKVPSFSLEVKVSLMTEIKIQTLSINDPVGCILRHTNYSLVEKTIWVTEIYCHFPSLMQKLKIPKPRDFFTFWGL